MLPLLCMLVSGLCSWIPWECSSWFNPLDGVFVSTFNAKHIVNVTQNPEVQKVWLSSND